MRRAAKFRMIMFFLASHCVAAASAEPVAVRPESDAPWDAGAGFSFDAGSKEKEDKIRRSASGIACAAKVAKKRVCLVVFDEGAQARFVALGDDGYEIENDRIILADGGELDAEGAAADRRFYYVTGSHSRKRGDCKKNRASRQVVRFAFDAATGKAARASTGALDGYAVSNRLWPLLKSLPEFAEHVGKEACNGGGSGSEENSGVDIEGLAVEGGRLYFGFRSPAKGESAYVLSVDAKALFSDEDLLPAVAKIEVGKGRGVRDMQAVTDGFLVLAGPDDGADKRQRDWVVALWSGGAGSAQPRMLARLDLGEVKLRPCDERIKPEALTVLEEEKDRYRILILSDGMCDGGPLTFEIRR